MKFFRRRLQAPCVGHEAVARTEKAAEQSKAEDKSDKGQADDLRKFPTALSRHVMLPGRRAVLSNNSLLAFRLL